jgi:penicillin amidase
MKIIYLSFSLILLGTALDAHSETMLQGLQAPVNVVRDTNGIPHIFADNEHDAFFMQGWVHAEDRLFQMDTYRRQIAGTLSELLGTDALEIDVQLRTLGLDRAAERSLNAHPQAFKDVLQAYSDGVNAYIDQAEATNNLPPEYAALQLTSVERWTPLDSIMVGKGLAVLTSLAPEGDIDLTLALGAYEYAGSLAGFDGTKLFFEDLYRSAPFNPAFTVPDADTGKAGKRNHDHRTTAARSHQPSSSGRRVQASKKTLEQAREYRELMHSLPKIPGIYQPEGNASGGSNTWVLSGANTKNGRPLLANDMHLALNNPTIFHQVHLSAPGLDVIGSGLAGAPCVVRGHNQHLAWGITNARLDINDVYSEEIVPDPASPSGLSTVYKGSLEPIEHRVETFLANINGQLVPVLNQDVLTVPRRNNGPIITEPEFDPDKGVLTALSLQSTGFSATRDPEGACGFNRARNLDEFKSALQLVDFASQNISYADTAGNIAFFVSGEVPLREDLQAAEPGDIVAPPFLIRSGTGGQEWIPEPDPQADQAVPYRILPFAEMPQIINPKSGVIVNANNDQIGNSLDNNSLNDFRPGGGLYYLSWGGRFYSIRAGRINELLEAELKGHGRLKEADMSRIQADVVMSDAQVFAPAIQQAFDRAKVDGAHPVLAALAADPRVAEAVERIADWDFSAPTGIPEGYDAHPGVHKDKHGHGKSGKHNRPSTIDNSVAATIYSVWRHEIVANTIDATLQSVGLPPLANEREERVTALRYLFDSFDSNQGVGASGLDFFPGPADADAATRRDINILQSLASALDRLASDDFKAAFNNSTMQDDYRWGKLHRILFEHTLGSIAGDFNVPPAFGLFPAPLEGLAGIPVDGGFETVDAGSPKTDIVSPGTDTFMFSEAASGRFVSQLKKHKVQAKSSLPGGESAIPGSPFYLNLLEPWLLNTTYKLQVSPDDVQADAYLIQNFIPAEQ